MNHEAIQVEAKSTSALNDAPYGETAVRLSAGQWLIVTVLVLATLSLAPRLWRRAEVFEPGRDYRVPFALSSDYWMYQRRADALSDRGDVAVVGDSVVWGEYVSPGQSLAAALDRRSDGPTFANAGINGGHPMALRGLMRGSGGVERGRPIIVHLNLLWMSSADRDLQVENIGGFNHPRLIPQFLEHVPAYQASINERMSAVIDRLFLYRSWVRHVRTVSFDGLDVPTWSFDHHYTDPISRLTLDLPMPKLELRHAPVSWEKSGIEKVDLPWLNLDDSLQWRAFMDLVNWLRDGGASPMVIVGPFNEHMLTDASRQRYGRVKAQAADWLTNADFAFVDAELLPSEFYGDASHPLAEGYEMIAAQVWRSGRFQSWLRRVGGH